MKKNLVAKNELGIYADGNGVVRADSLVVAQIFGKLQLFRCHLSFSALPGKVFLKHFILTVV